VILPFPDRYIFQDPRFQPVTDASALLVEYILNHEDNDPRILLELGSGCGIVSIMLALSRPDWQITALEIQPEQVELSRRNAVLCGCLISFHEADLRTWTTPGWDLIIANPPWLPVGKGLSSPIPERRIGREEVLCAMTDILNAVSRLLNPAGEAVLIYPRARLAELQSLTDKTSLDIIDLVFTNGTKQYLICRLKQRGNNDC